MSVANFVEETTTTTGTGTYSLGGAKGGRQSFVSGIGSGQVAYYAVTDGINWEVGFGTVTAGTPDTLTRTTILASSNAGSAVNWGAGTKDIYCAFPAARVITQRPDGVTAVPGPMTVGGTATLTGTLGVGVVAKTWQSTRQAVQAGNAAIYGTASAASAAVGANVYLDSAGAFKRIIAGAASIYSQSAGTHVWSVAASGSADATITFSDAMQIDLSANIQAGTTTSGIGSTAARMTVQAATDNFAGVFATTQAAYEPVLAWNKATSGNNGFVSFGTEGTYTTRGGITYNRGAGVVAFNTTSDYRAKDLHSLYDGAGAIIDSVPVHLATMKGATIARPMFVAHELQDGGAGFAVTGEKDAVDADGNPILQQVDASVLVPLLWAEVQSLRARLAAAGIA